MRTEIRFSIRRPVIGIGLAASILFLLTACGGGGGGGSTQPAPVKQAVSTAASIDPLPVGDANCPQGGVRVKTGIDENGNGLLDDSEVDAEQNICHGINTKVAISDEPIGPNCANGGLRIDSGQDTNANGVLDTGEILDTAYVCNASVARAGWEPGSTLYGRSYPVLASNAAGQALLVTGYWYGSTSWSLWANFYDPSAGWRLYDFIALSGSNPSRRSAKARLDANGNGMVVWFQDADADGNHEIMSRTRLASDTDWSPPVQLNSDTRNLYDENVAFDLNSAGQGLLVWVEGSSLFAKYHPNYTGGWGSVTETIANITSGGYLNRPWVVMDEDGRGMALWVEVGPMDVNRMSDVTIYASRFDPSASPSWSTPVAISETKKIGGLVFISGDSVRVTADVDGAGNVYAAWWQRNDVDYNTPGDSFVYTARFDATSDTWGAAEEVFSFTPTSPQDMVGDRIALGVNAVGDLAIAWNGVVGNADFPMVVRREAGATTWEGPKTLLTGRFPKSEFELDLALDDSGNLMVMWQDSSGVVASRYDAATGWQPIEEIVSIPYSGYIRNLNLSKPDALGNFFASVGMPIGTGANYEDWHTHVRRFLANP